jgi:hypothetical protein
VPVRKSANFHDYSANYKSANPTKYCTTLSQNSLKSGKDFFVEILSRKKLYLQNRLGLHTQNAQITNPQIANPQNATFANGHQSNELLKSANLRICELI